MKYIPLSMFFVIFNSNPFTTALLGYFWLSEKLSAFEVVAMLCAFGGIVIMSMAKPTGSDDSPAVMEADSDLGSGTY